MEGVTSMDINDNSEPGCYTEHGVSGYGVAAQLSRNEMMTEAFIKAMAEQMMRSIADKCMEMGARCIGHIKSHLKTEAGGERKGKVDQASPDPVPSSSSESSGWPKSRPTLLRSRSIPNGLRM